MRSKYFQIVFAGLIIIQTFLYSADRFTFQFGTEGGYYDSEDLGSRMISRFIGRLNYSNSFENNFIAVKTRLAPELYGLSFSASTIKLNGQMYFGQHLKKFTWQTHLATRNYFYRSNDYEDISFNVFRIGADLSKPVKRNTSVGLGLDYYFRDSSHRLQSQLDVYSLSLISSCQINRSINLTTDILIESFTIRNRFKSDSLNNNDGFRYGSKIAFNHRSNFILNFSYQIIRHSSELLRKDHWENQLTLLWGRIFARKWSLFFYLNYLFSPDTNQEVPVELTYTPINNENWYHLKLGYDLSKRRELYLKFGYSRDVLIYTKQDLAGWQFLAGLDVKF